MPYTKDQVARLTESAPISYEDAVALGTELGYSTRSVIAKTKSLELEYIPKAVPAKRPTPLTKSQVVDLIAYSTGAELDGLAGATLASLTVLLDAVS